MNHTHNKQQRPINRWAVVLLLLSVQVFCIQTTSAGSPLMVVDDQNISLHFTSPVKRIVSLSPHATETLFAIGAGAQVVAVDRYSNYPVAAKTLPQAGDIFSLNIEVIANFKPDLVIVAEHKDAARLRTQLALLGIQLFVSAPREVMSVGHFIEQMGRLTGHSVNAQQIARDYQFSIENTTLKYTQRSAVPTYFQFWSDPLMVATDRSLVGDALIRCGAKNLAPSSNAAQMTINIEVAIVANPEIVISGAAGGKDNGSLKRYWEKYPSVAATKGNAFMTIDADLISRMGPRFPLGLKALCEGIDTHRTKVQTKGKP